MSRSRHVVGTREWEQDVYEHIANHGQIEGEILDEYASLADDETISPAFSYLAGIILEDEVRHHRVFEELAETMRQMGADALGMENVGFGVGMRGVPRARLCRHHGFPGRGSRLRVCAREGREAGGRRWNGIAHGS